jgi:AcrR family transcriptional regulator
VSDGKSKAGKPGGGVTATAGPEATTVAARVPPAPVISSAASLPPTALKILEAAKKLLVSRGYEALTLERIAAKAGVNKASTRYYFGSKAGLLEAIVDEIVLDECASMARNVPRGAPLEERVDGFIQGVRKMATDTASFGGFYDILPRALRDHNLRARLVRLYEVWYAWNLEWLVLEQVEDQRQRESLAAMGQLTAATIDGIAIQASIHGREYDPEPTLKTLRYCLLTALR